LSALSGKIHNETVATILEKILWMGPDKNVAMVKDLPVKGSFLKNIDVLTLTRVAI
jgi:hypothetical protein